MAKLKRVPPTFALHGSMSRFLHVIPSNRSTYSSPSASSVSGNAGVKVAVLVAVVVPVVVRVVGLLTSRKL